MHSRIVAIVGTVAIALLGSAGAMAQDATPEASPGGESLFAELGLPELTVTATNEGFGLRVRGRGRTLFGHLVNETDILALRRIHLDGKGKRLTTSRSPMRWHPAPLCRKRCRTAKHLPGPTIRTSLVA
jgi:hypothetical protein